MLIPPNLAAAGMKSAGGITQSVIGRYRPAGVPRTGSREDRAAAYRRLLDSSTRTFAYTYMNSHMNREAGWAGRGYIKGQMGIGWEVSAEMVGALHGVRLCGTVPVIIAAEEMVTAAGEMNFGEKDGAVFQAAADGFAAAQSRFLNAARTDLAYNPRWWQVLRRRSDRRHLEAAEQRAAAAELDA